MKKRNFISFGAALILLFGYCFCENRDEASSSNQRYSSGENFQTADAKQIIKCPRCNGTALVKLGKLDERQRYMCKKCKKSFTFGKYYGYGVNQRRSKASQDSLSKEGDACFYLNNILPKNESINRQKPTTKRSHMIVAYYKQLGGTYDKDKKSKLQYETRSKAAKYLGVNEKTVRRALSKLTSTEFEKIDQEAIKDKADKIVENYKSHPNKDSSNSPLIGAIIGLRDLGFSCLRIIELLGLEENFDSKRKNQNIIPVAEASSSNQRYPVDNRNPRMRIENLLNESLLENRNITPVAEASSSNQRYPVDNRNSRMNEAEDNESVRKRSLFEENLSDDESLENKRKKRDFKEEVCF